MGFAAFLTGFISTVAQVGRAIIGVVAPVAKVIIRSAKELVDLVVGFTEGMRAEPKSERERSERELQEVNAGVADLVKRHRDNGGLNEAQNKRWKDLKSRRDVLNGEISAIDKFTTAKEIVAEEKNYRPVVITDANAQVLQYHVGQSTHNKMCVCRRPMVLQWDRQKSTAGLHDFFWGCSGFYIHVNGRTACMRTKRLTFEDLNLFANMNRPEFETDSATLTLETINPVKARRIRQALDAIRDKHRDKRLGIAVYRCPVHGESLRLERSREQKEKLFEQYFLGCPLWLKDKTGCNFKVTLKSAAQISSVLDTEQSTGVLGV
ncbi:hypothetical protein [Rhodoferax sp.]|uniref:hypothetical protein n=1 Tax=Rhodoferax sp. TaxID=50421 RepID=UPI0027665C01|nr:hypothetical protein [Rhodoferax sp.]